VGEADLFVAASSVDENNLVACVSARHLGAKRTTCFLTKLDFQAPREDRINLAESLGIDRVVVPAERLAAEILRIVVIPGALDVEVFVGGNVHLLRHGIEAGAPIVHGPLMDIGVPEGVVLVMARRGDQMFIPKGTTHFQPGDKVTAMGTKAGINRLLYRYLRSAGRVKDATRATVIGGGSVGLAVARGLEDLGWTVKVFETDRKRCEEISPLLKGLVLHGDGTDLDLLESERIGDDPVLVAVTSNDEKNLLVSLLAKHLGVRRILTRVDQQANERVFEKVGIDVVLSARGAAIRSVLEGIGHTKADLLAELEHGDAQVIEIEVPQDREPTPLMSMDPNIFAIIGAILRHGRVIIPRGTDVVQPGDRLLTFCRREDEGAVREFFGHTNRDRGR
jgi:trk system potassium uptake protein TrkA